MAWSINITPEGWTQGVVPCGGWQVEDAAPLGQFERRASGKASVAQLDDLPGNTEGTVRLGGG
jgi:hypothetical protein